MALLFMSFIMYTEFFTLDWNLSKSALVPMHIKTKFQNETKTEPHKIFTTLCCYFSLAKFCQVRYTIKKSTRKKNVL